MTINEKTRESRIAIWTAKKRVWGAKQAAATNESDTAVAKLMFDEAEDALKRLGVNTKAKVVSEEEMYSKSKMDEITKKVKVDRGKTTETHESVDAPKKKNTNTDEYPHKAKGSTDTTGTIGL